MKCKCDHLLVEHMFAEDLSKNKWKCNVKGCDCKEFREKEGEVNIAKEYN